MSSASHRYRRTPGGIRSTAISNARKRAAKQGLPFTLTLDNVMLPPPECPCCGRVMEVGSTRGGGPDSPTLDRIIPEDGYVPDNVMWLCYACNMVKGSTTPDTLGHLYLVADWLYERYRERRIPCPTRLRPLSLDGTEGAGGDVQQK